MTTLKTQKNHSKKKCVKKCLLFSLISCVRAWFGAYSPGTVVVHFADAVAAAAAVVGAFGAHEIALVAQLPVLPLCRGRTATVSQDTYSSGGDIYVVSLWVHFLFPHLTEVCEGWWEDVQDPPWRLWSTPQSRGPTKRNNLSNIHTFTHGYKPETSFKVGGIRWQEGCRFIPWLWGSRDQWQHFSWYSQCFTLTPSFSHTAGGKLHA